MCQVASSCKIDTLPLVRVQRAKACHYQSRPCVWGVFINDRHKPLYALCPTTSYGGVALLTVLPAPYLYAEKGLLRLTTVHD